MPDDSEHRGERGQPSADYRGQASADRLAVKLSELARHLREGAGVQETLDAIVRAGVDTIAGAEHAGVTVVRRRRTVETKASTDEVVREADRAQYETGQGPCLDAIYLERTVRVSDMSAERRWPAFVERARGLGVASMLSFQLYVHEDNLGALNLYAGRPDAFGDESEHVGLLFAAHAAVAMSGAQQEEHLSRAVAMRDLIGQAKGILMERHRLTADQAFTLLVSASQETNTRLADIARHLVHTGELAGRRIGQPLGDAARGEGT
ncbi:GAF and ANTAR domain-containing protein [Nonomuraea sp. MCN248]|uniref:GAF and ANTAR domain-containing protein n=1 Tax=Nonomuraea corallina TaxID=2989783 RepID=A0ABT4S6P4_9ACTN|nr:GAF and ANTAR domain-containing protein [Nonomuraea corallina]MDA0632718.1 GAF and ANTAR domain-containing protein [Nonomuraea corallina]